MHLRNLKIKDAPLMLEWMHDSELTKYLKVDFLSKKIDDCESFIHNASGVHFAVADEFDEYLGTVSLKKINNDSAEFAIAMRRKALGSGIAYIAMLDIIKYGFNDLKLKSIYWCVDPHNLRALRFYLKHNYECIDIKMVSDISGYSEEEKNIYLWFQISYEQWVLRQIQEEGYKVL